jgi:hypothetical protein
MHAVFSPVTYCRASAARRPNRPIALGVSFTNGAGGAQTIIFHAVPELSTLGLALLTGLSLPVRVRRIR